jgi:UDP-N-acetylglucosamine 2-epimerase
VDKHGIVAAMTRALDHRKELPQKSPYGDGNAAQHIAEIIEKELVL